MDSTAHTSNRSPARIVRSLSNDSIDDEDFSDVYDIDDIIQAKIEAKNEDQEGKSIAMQETLNADTATDATGPVTATDVAAALSLNVEKAQSEEEEEEALLPKSTNDLVNDSAIKASTVSFESPERRLLNIDDDGFAGEDEEEEDDYHDDYVEAMDDSHLQLKHRLSIMERMQSKLLVGSNPKEEKLLPQDTFSFLIIAENWSIPFVAALWIVTLQMTTFVLVLLDLSAQGEPGNVFGVPANVSAQLRATQFIAVLVAVLTQGDLRTAITLLRDGFTKDFDTAFMETAEWKYRLSILLRAVSGSVGLMVSFVLIVTAPSVVELLLNFTGE